MWPISLTDEVFMTFVASLRIRSVGCVYAGRCVYAPDAAFTHMCVYAGVGAYTRVGVYTQAGVRIRGGCVYASRGAYTRVGANTRFKMCVYAFITTAHTHNTARATQEGPNFLLSCLL